MIDNWKVVCINNDKLEKYFTIGKIYNSKIRWVQIPYPDMTMFFDIIDIETGKYYTVDTEEAEKCFKLLADFRDERINEIINE
jgi:hypothetical protein